MFPVLKSQFSPDKLHSAPTHIPFIKLHNKHKNRFLKQFYSRDGCRPTVGVMNGQLTGPRRSANQISRGIIRGLTLCWILNVDDQFVYLQSLPINSTLAWVLSVKYLGIYLVSGRKLSFDIKPAKRSFFMACNVSTPVRLFSYITPGIFLSILTYGVTPVSLNVSQYNELNA